MNPTELRKVIASVGELIEMLKSEGIATGDLDNILRVLSTETHEQPLHEALQWLHAACGPRGLPDIYLSKEGSVWLGKISILRSALNEVLPRPQFPRSAKKLLKGLNGSGSD